MYTKKLDKSTLSKAQQDKAAHYAHMIESQDSDNVHLRQERGHALEEGNNDGDEEALWSGVIGTGGFKKGSAVNNTDGGAWKRGAVQGASPKASGDARTAGKQLDKADKGRKDDKPAASAPAAGTWAARAAGLTKEAPKEEGAKPQSAQSGMSAAKPVTAAPVSATSSLKAALAAAPAAAAAAPAAEKTDVPPAAGKVGAADASKAPVLKATAKEFVFTPRAAAKEYTPSVTAVTKAITGNTSPSPARSPALPAMPAGFPQAPAVMMPTAGGGFDGGYQQPYMMYPPNPNMGYANAPLGMPGQSGLLDEQGMPMPMPMMQMPNGMMMPMPMYGGYDQHQNYMMQQGMGGAPPGPGPVFGFQGQGGGGYGGYGGHSDGGRGGGGRGRGGRGGGGYNSGYNQGNNYRRDYNDNRNMGNGSESSSSPGPGALPQQTQNP